MSKKDIITFLYFQNCLYSFTFCLHFFASSLCDCFDIFLIASIHCTFVQLLLLFYFFYFVVVVLFDFLRCTL